MVIPVALKSANFRNFLVGATVSEIGNQMQTVAVAWHMYDLTHNPASLGLIGLANFLPIIFLSLIGGVAADKHDRKRMLIIGQILLAMITGALFIVTDAHTVS